MLKIITYPNPILDKSSEKVKIPLTPQTQDLIRQMYDTVEGIGVGLAAPQVGLNLQICIIRLDPDMAFKKDKDLEFVIINPEITFYSAVKNQMIEGCLSFPKQYYDILRPANIIVKFETIANFKEFVKNPNVQPKIKTQTLKVGGWMSRVIQHEVDHLSGKLFINLGGKKLKTDKLDGRQVID